MGCYGQGEGMRHPHPHKIRAMLSPDLFLVLLFSGLLVMTLVFRESALRHVQAQMEEGALIAARHLTLEVENLWVPELTAKEQPWWSDVMERILSVDQRLVSMTVLADDGTIITQHEHQAPQDAVRFIKETGTGLSMQIVFDAKALNRVKAECSGSRSLAVS